MPDPDRFPHDHSQPLVVVSGLGVRYLEAVALSGVSFHLCRGEFVAIIGPNGAGKSTLLKALLGLLPQHSNVELSGEVLFSPQLGPKPRQAIAYVPQNRALDWRFPVTVWDVVMMARVGHQGWLRRASRRDVEVVMAALERAELVELRQRPIQALSGGQRQRALLARMIAREAPVLFLDEPMSGVDAVSEANIMGLLEEERGQGKGILMVTHNLEAAREWCSHLLLVNETVIASGKPERVYTPEHISATFSRGVRGKYP
jgi:manganese/iron transport system ATP-binding protein